MIRKVLRLRVCPGGLRVAEIDRFLIRIEPRLGPADVPIDERDAGFRAQAFVATSGVALFEDWSPTLTDAKIAAAEWLAARLGARRWGVA